LAFTGNAPLALGYWSRDGFWEQNLINIVVLRFKLAVSSIPSNFSYRSVFWQKAVIYLKTERTKNEALQNKLAIDTKKGPYYITTINHRSGKVYTHGRINGCYGSGPFPGRRAACSLLAFRDRGWSSRPGTSPPTGRSRRRRPREWEPPSAVRPWNVPGSGGRRQCRGPLRSGRRVPG
jgi:hypothetical protein